MTERDLIMQRMTPVVARLRELGYQVPECPESDGNKFKDCDACNGSGNESVDVYDADLQEHNKEEVNCLHCGGSGQQVANALMDWTLAVNKLVSNTRPVKHG